MNRPLIFFTTLSVAAHAALFGMWSDPDPAPAETLSSEIEIGLVLLPQIEKSFSSVQQKNAAAPTKSARKARTEVESVPSRDKNKSLLPDPPLFTEVTEITEKSKQVEMESETDAADRGSDDTAGAKPMTSTEAAPLHAENPAPRYPAEALRHGWEGEVWLIVSVNRRGGVDSIQIDRSSGYPVLDRAASVSVSNWQFTPARVGQERVEGTVRIPIRFQIKRT